MDIISATRKGEHSHETSVRGRRDGLWNGTCASTESLAQYLTGSGREDFIRGAVNGCMREKIKDQEASAIPNSLFEVDYCRC